ncbi:hypothetical protein Bca4012_052828 [Brassica carinata]
MDFVLTLSLSDNPPGKTYLMEEEAQEDCHTVDHFTVDDLLVDFSNDDDEENDVIADSDGANAATAVPDNSNSSSFSTAGLPIFHGDVHDGTSFSSCVPFYWLAELEWIAISNSPIFTNVSVPAKGRSKRSRADTCNWASSGLLMEAVYDNPFTGETVLSNHHLSPPISPTSIAHIARKQTIDGLRRKKGTSPVSGSGEERRCLHCAIDKTPQWRTDPMGLKTFVQCLWRQKVMELRRKKEMIRYEFIHHHHDSLSD